MPQAPSAASTRTFRAAHNAKASMAASRSVSWLELATSSRAWSTLRPLRALHRSFCTRALRRPLQLHRHRRPRRNQTGRLRLLRFRRRHPSRRLLHRLRCLQSRRSCVKDTSATTIRRYRERRPATRRLLSTSQTTTVVLHATRNPDASPSSTRSFPGCQSAHFSVDRSRLPSLQTESTTTTRARPRRRPRCFRLRAHQTHRASLPVHPIRPTLRPHRHRGRPRRHPTLLEKRRVPLTTQPPTRTCRSALCLH